MSRWEPTRGGRSPHPHKPPISEGQPQTPTHSGAGGGSGSGGEPQPQTNSGMYGVTRWIQGASVTLHARGKTLQLLAWKGPPELSGGIGGTEVVTIPKGSAVVDWNGHPPFQLKLPLLIDGYPQDKHIEDDIQMLMRFARADEDADFPPIVKVAGPLPKIRPRHGWVIEDLEWQEEDLIRREGHTVRLRQAVVVTLIEANRPSLAVRDSHERHNGSGHHVGPRTRSYKVKRGETLKQIAKRFHVAGGAKALAKLNHIRDPKHVKAGTRIKIPLADTFGA